MQQKQNLPKQQGNKLSQHIPAPPLQQPHIVMRQQHMGPIPDPDTLERYEHILPGIAERIMAQTEIEQSARLRREDVILTNQHSQHKRDTDTYRIGQYLAAFSVILVVGLCIYLGSRGFATQAATVGTGAIAAVAAVFIAGRSKETKENKETKKIGQPSKSANAPDEQ